MKRSQGGVSVRLLKETLAAARRTGVETRSILLRAGIDPGVLELDANHVSADDYGKLWVAIADTLDDEFFGEDPHPMRRGSFALMAQACVTAANGEKALRRAVSFLRLVLDNIEGRVVSGNGYVRLEIHHRQQPTMFAYATYFILVYGLVCWLVDRRISIIRTVLDCEVPSASEEYQLMFCDDMMFGSSASFIDLSADLLTLPVVQTPTSLRYFLRDAPGNFVAKYRRSDSLAARIKKLLQQMPPAEWPNGDDMARLLRQAPATMRRRLNAEGVSYQSVKDATRCKEAIALLEQPDRAVVDVATAVGYAEPSAFHRAFLKWTGMTPHAFRKARDLG
jgi:AraC-like DNA-binding protein